MMEIPPKYPISLIVQQLKSVSSIWLRQRFPFIKNAYAKRGKIWSAGYFVATIGLNEEQIKKYITFQNQFDIPEDLNAEFEWQRSQKETPHEVRGGGH